MDSEHSPSIGPVGTACAETEASQTSKAESARQARLRHKDSVDRIHDDIQAQQQLATATAAAAAAGAPFPVGQPLTRSQEHVIGEGPSVASSSALHRHHPPLPDIARALTSNEAMEQPELLLCAPGVASASQPTIAGATNTDCGKLSAYDRLILGLNHVDIRRLAHMIEEKTIAEKIRRAAEHAEERAEAARQTAETARQTAETARQTAEVALKAVSAKLVHLELLQSTTSSPVERPEEAKEEAEEDVKEEATAGAAKIMKRKKEPPFTEEEDYHLIAKLPITKGQGREVARLLTKLPELSRRTEASIYQRLRLIEKNLENGLGLGGAQKAEQTLAPGLEPAKAALRHVQLTALLATGGVELPPGSLDSLYMARPADMAPTPTGKAPMMDEPTWLTGGKGERLGLILFERLFNLQTKLVRQGLWGGPDLVAFDTSSAEIAMHVEVKTVPASTQEFVRNTTATIRIDKVRRKQSTVLLVVIYHEAGLDFFVRPTADFCASYGNRGSKFTASSETAELALIGVLHNMLQHYRFRHLACYRRQTHHQKLRFWEHAMEMAASSSATAAAASTSTSAAAASASAPQWPLLAPMMSARPLPLLPPLPPLPSAACTDVLASARLSALERVANMSTSLVALSGMMHLPASQPGAELYMRFVDEMACMPQHTLVLAFHGTPEPNVDPIGAHGLDPAMRVGDIRGHGEYFAESISMALPYMQGARRLLVFLLLVPSDGLCTPTGLVHRGDGGMIVMAKPSQQLPIATVDVTYVGLTSV